MAIWPAFPVRFTRCISAGFSMKTRFPAPLSGAPMRPTLKSKARGIQYLIQAPMTRCEAAFSWKHQSRSINSEKVTNMNNVIQPQLSILRRKQVQARTGLSRSTIYLYIKAGQFPKPVALGPRAVGWIESEVSEWIAKRVRIASDNAR